MDIILQGFSMIATPMGIGAIMIGVVIGIIVGALPGLGQGTALLLTLPIAISYPMEFSLIIYSALLGATTFGGSITSIVLGIPGSAQNLVTILDGYPMARRGEASRAIGLAAFSSLFGALMGMVVVILLLPFVRILMYVYGAREYFMTIVLAAVIVAFVSSDFWKGLASFGIGAMVSLVGVDMTFGVTRYTGGLFYFWGKIPIAVFIIGLFALNGLVMLQAKGSTIVSDTSLFKARPLDALRAFPEIIRNFPVVARSSVIGVIVGILPGIGGEVAQFVSYGAQKGLSKNKEDYGKGEPKGVIASESSNNAKDSGALLPTLCLGIPGSPEMSIMLGILLVLGITTGPSILATQGNILGMILIAAVIGNVIAGIICVFGSTIITRITIVPINFVFAVTVMLASAATYAWATNMWDVLMLIPFCLLGMLLTRAAYPITNLILGYVLGPLAERSFHTTLQSGLYDPIVFLNSMTAMVLFIAVVALLAWSGINKIRKSKKRALAADGEAGPVNEHGDPGKLNDIAGQKERFFLAVGLAVVSVLFIVIAPSYGAMKSGLFPLVMSALMLFSLVFILIGEGRNLVRLKRLGDAVRVRGNNWSQYLKPLVFLACYAVALILFGFYAGNFIMFTIFFRWFQKSSWPKAALFGVIFVAVVYVIFAIAFKAILWPGSIPMIIPNFFGGGHLRPFV
ncbi:MAG: tripartite tricarboxylate transporter permease [Clostridiales bacterium]|nr:tripartite tricarboxylate transporter permease [Clostridiales bacterium]